MGKPVDGKKIIEEAKEKVKQQKQKEPITMKKTIIITVTLTLTAVAILVGSFLLGAAYNQSINDRVHSEAKTLSAIQPSKQ